ncbi:hypothetical protein U1Q18_015126, partial [Sarracenia purpurea var. burkii]
MQIWSLKSSRRNPKIACAGAVTDPSRGHSVLQDGRRRRRLRHLVANSDSDQRVGARLGIRRQSGTRVPT